MLAAFVAGLLCVIAERLLDWYTAWSAKQRA
jgi:hypothetical protein